MNRYVIDVKYIVNTGWQIYGSSTSLQQQFENRYYCDENSLDSVLKNIISSTDNIISISINTIEPIIKVNNELGKED